MRKQITQQLENHEQGFNVSLQYNVNIMSLFSERFIIILVVVWWILCLML